MKTQIFDGRNEAKARERVLAKKVARLNKPPRLCSIVFEEDAGSQLYTKLKFEAAFRVGMEFDRVDVSCKESVDLLREQIVEAGERVDVTGVLIQKPMRSVWREVMGLHERGAFAAWWREVSSAIELSKDVDGLHPVHLEQIYAGTWRLLPATVKAVLSILEIALQLEVGTLTFNNQSKLDQPLNLMKMVVVGRSEIIGRPLAAILEQKGAKVALVGSKAEDLGFYTTGADIVVSATGVPGIISEDIVKPEVILIDVGSPKADISGGCLGDAKFITPVPGGVGPMTVVSLLENLVTLIA